MSSKTFSYDIHQILTVESDVALPELAAFKIDLPLREPTIRVVLGNVDEAESRPSMLHGRSVTYKERTGRHGFAIHIDLAQHVLLVASPFLAHSPHVLYTNAVEPVLRWAFVERGYALVHGACMAEGDRAFLITARTDTGKTTTVLKTLDAHPEYSFLSDDLTIIREDGTVLPYPKPLTISRHTLHAVKTPLLSMGERFALFFQSRLHSKSGRTFGLLLTRFNLPMATVNSLVQWVIPPPKYHVQRLVPHVKIASRASLTGLVVIERGDPRELRLNHEEAVETLLANCEDSYGFPPYADIKESLYLTDQGDLREEEHRIVDAALTRCPAVVMRSQARNWFQLLPDFIDGVIRPRSWVQPEVAYEAASD
jgi:hypothetical protein